MPPDAGRTVGTSRQEAFVHLELPATVEAARRGATRAERRAHLDGSCQSHRRSARRPTGASAEKEHQKGAVGASGRGSGPCAHRATDPHASNRRRGISRKLFATGRAVGTLFLAEHLHQTREKRRRPHRHRIQRRHGHRQVHRSFRCPFVISRTARWNVSGRCLSHSLCSSARRLPRRNRPCKYNCAEAAAPSYAAASRNDRIRCATSAIRCKWPPFCWNWIRCNKPTSEPIPSRWLPCARTTSAHLIRRRKPASWPKRPPHPSPENRCWKKAGSWAIRCRFRRSAGSRPYCRATARSTTNNIGNYPSSTGHWVRGWPSTSTRTTPTNRSNDNTKPIPT